MIYLILTIVVIAAIFCGYRGWQFKTAYDQLKADNSALTDPLEQRIDHMRNSAELSDLTLARLKEELANERALHEQQKGLAATAKATSDQTSVRLKNATNDLQAAQAQVGALQAQVTQLQAQVDPTLGDQLQAAKRDLETALGNTQRLATQADALRAELAEANTRLDQAVHEAANLRKYQLWFQELWAVLGQFPKAFTESEKKLGKWDKAQEQDVQNAFTRIRAYYNVAILFRGVIDNIAAKVGSKFPTATELVSNTDDSRARLNAMIAKLQLGNSNEEEVAELRRQIEVLTKQLEEATGEAKME